MNKHAIWVGLPAVWILAGVAAYALLTTPADNRPSLPQTAQPEPAVVASRSAQPLEWTEQAPEVTPEAPEVTVEIPEAPPVLTPAKTTREKYRPGFEEEPTPFGPCVSPATRKEATEEPATTSFVSRHHSVQVASGVTLDFQPGDVEIQGDFNNQGTINAKHSTVIFDGADQTLEGGLTAAKVVLRGGVKRLRGSFTAAGTGSRNAEPGKAGLYVEAGTTLIIEEGGKWTAPNPYSFQVAGHLIIDGGTFHCSFSNGNGTDRGEKSWLPGSELTIRSGSFIGTGDADFSGAAITIHDGSLEINDDLWSTGTSLIIYGGLMRNSKHGGMFHLTGNVNIYGGELQVYQNGSRSLRIHPEAVVYGTAGTVSIHGSAARGDNGAMLIGNSAVLPNLQINTTVRIHKDSAPTGYLSVGGEFTIAKGHKFEAAGFNVIASIGDTTNQGQFVP